MRWRLWPSAVLLAVPAALAMVCNHPTRYVGDNRFEQYWAPGWRIVRETMLWDGTRGMGRVGEEFWPTTIPMAFLRSLGLSPALTEHTWHAVVLVLAGTGIVSLVRVFQPRIGAAHLIAGFAYMCNPFSLTFLVPSNLYWNYALAPWLLVVAISGVRATTPALTWRWAALWAVLVYTAGDTDLPGLVFAALWLIPVLVFAVYVERWITWRDVGRWLGRAALLTALVSAAALVKIVLGASALGDRLLYTETPLQVNRTSSWTESFRGLGYWLSYFRSPGRDVDVPGGLYWYESVGGVLSTFILPAMALVAAWGLRWRTRLLLLAVALSSAVVMVGSYRPDQPPPAGGLLLAAYRAVPSLSSLRNTYKAGSGLMIAVSVLVGIGASALGTQLARRSQRWVQPIGAVVLVGVIGVGGLPLWNGGLYPKDKEMTSIPAYWHQAADWIERQPGDARVLVLPGSTQTAYRWGWAGDDILDSLFRRHANVVPTNFPVSGAITADVIDALERRIAEGSLTADELVPVAQRLGIGWVLIRNDLDWDRLREPRPALLDQLRDGATLRRVRTFGRIGQYTAAVDDQTDTANAERRLPPIEVYRVPPALGSAATDAADAAEANQQLARSSGTPVFVDGDGAAWPTLAALGVLRSGRPLRFAAATTPTVVANALDQQGASLVVTDTNRRRLTLIRGPGPTSSETLGEGQGLSQAPQDLFGVPHSQTVAVYPDAESISASGSGSELTGFSPSLRAANAFDGLASTAWRAGGLTDPVGNWIHVRFRQPQELSELTLTPWRDEKGVRSVSQATLKFDDGSKVVVDLPADRPSVVARFPRRSTRALTIEISGVRGTGTAAVGFTEIAIPKLDLQEYIATPDHLFRSTDPVVQAALANDNVSYLFRRSIGTASDEEELRLRRQFPTAGTRDWRITARLSPSTAPLDQVIDRLYGGPVGAYGSSRIGKPSESRGGLAVDGRLDTAWAARPHPGENLTVHFPTHEVDHVRVVVGAGPNDYPLHALRIRVGQGVAQRVPVVADPTCTLPGCPRIAELTVTTRAVGRIVLTLADGDDGGRPARIAEVQVNGPDGPVKPAGRPSGRACAAGIVELDGQSVPLASEGPLLSDLDAGTVTLTSCAPTRLTPGTHRLTTTAGARVDEISLEPSPAPEGTTVPPPITARVTHRTPVAIDLAVTAPDPGTIITGQSYDAGWRATADGHDLGRPFELEGQSAWSVPKGTHVVRLRFVPQRWYAVALATSFLGLVACAWLILRRAARPGRATPPSRAKRAVYRRSDPPPAAS